MIYSDPFSSDPGPVLSMAEVVMLKEAEQYDKPEDWVDWLHILASIWPDYPLDTILDAVERTKRHCEGPVLAGVKS